MGYLLVHDEIIGEGHCKLEHMIRILGRHWTKSTLMIRWNSGYAV